MSFNSLKAKNLMALSKSLRTSSSGFRTFGAGFFSCTRIEFNVYHGAFVTFNHINHIMKMPKTSTCGGEVIVGIFFGGEEEDEEVCLATPERKLYKL